MTLVTPPPTRRAPRRRDIVRYDGTLWRVTSAGPDSDGRHILALDCLRDGKNVVVIDDSHLVRVHEPYPEVTR